MSTNFHPPTTAQIYLYSLLNTLTINLRNQKHRLSLVKHIVLGIVIGMLISFIISSLYTSYFLSFWGNKIACPIITGGINIIGCTAGFIYLNEILGIILGVIFGFLIFTVRKTIEKAERIAKL